MCVKHISSLFFLILLIFSFNGCFTTEYNAGSHTQDIMMYSYEREINLGLNVSHQVAEQYKISRNPFDIKRVNDIGERIAAVSDRQAVSYYFYIIDKDDLNAFSLPGGYVYVFKGLLDKLTDDELAFVLAHEVGHIVSRHGIKRLQAALGYNLILAASTTAPSADPDFTMGVALALNQLMSEYSQDAEFNADEIAVRYSSELGYDPNAGITLLQKIEDLERGKIRPKEYFRTHPFSSQRIANIKKLLHLPLSAEDYANQ
ncbi:MAG: M48 family metalloprotease [Candidatus Omnitrophica bacterium]|nr:M48 family metalloprotease [Candidatus Omnitrophota bacterium]MDD5080775.1 M48 family metalloprotease [Candidatus Omnitrophota bacterium]